MAKKRTPSKKTAPKDTVHQLKITLIEIDPPIWRQVLVPSDASLGDLNYVLQAAMGWSNSHLHEFRVKDIAYSDPRLEMDDVEDERGVTLADVAPRARSRFDLLYDFGDGWEHTIVVEKVLPRAPDEILPRCLAGERACPPEDCGGPWGYYDLLEAIGDPKHEEHDEMLEWVGEGFAPEAFDVTALNKQLHHEIKLMSEWQ